MRRRRRRWLIGTAIGLAVLVAAGLILRHVARQRVRAELETWLETKFEGRARVGSVDGWLLGSTTIHDVELRDAAGRRVVYAARIDADFDLLAALRGDIVLSSATVGGLELDFRRLASRPSAGGGGGGGRFIVERLVARGAAVTLRDGVTLAGVDAALGVVSVGGRTEVRIDGAAARWVERGAPVALARGAVVVERGRVAAGGLALRVGEVGLAAPYFFAATESGEVTAAVHVEGTATAARAVFPKLPPWEGAVTASGVVAIAPGQPWRARLEGHAGGVAFDASAALDGAGLVADVQARGVEPARFVAGAPALRVDVDGRVFVDATRVSARASVTAPEGRLRLRGRRLADGRFAARFRGFDVEVARFAAAARGRADFDVVATGTPDRLRIVGWAQGDRLGVGATAADSARVEVDVAGSWAALAGSVRLDARGLTTAGSRVGRVALEGEAAREGGAARLALGDIAVAGQGLEWRGRGGELRLEAGGRFSGRDLRLSSRAGRIEASGWLDGDEAELELALDDGDARRLGRAYAPRARVPAGRVDARAHVERRAGRLAIDVEGTGRGPAGELETSGRLAGGRLAGTAHLRGPEVGDLMVTIDARAPGDPLSARAWRRLDRDKLRSVDVTAQHVDLGALGLGEGVKGRLDGHLELGAGARAGRIELRATGLALGGAELPVIDVDVDGTLAGGVLAATAAVDAGDAGRAELTFSASLPARPFDLAAWRRLDEGAVRSAAARIEGVALERLLRAARLPAVATGVVDGELEVAAGVTSIAVDLTCRRGRLDGVAVPLEARLVGTVGEDRSSGRIEVALDGAPAAAADVEVAAGLAQLRAGVRDAALAGDLRVDGVPADLFGRAFAPGEPLGGRVTARAHLGGTIRAPTATFAVEVADPAAAGLALAQLSVDGRADLGGLIAQGVALQGDGGRLGAELQLPRAGKGPLQLHVVADRFDLAFLDRVRWGDLELWRGFAGRLDADVQLARGANGQRVRGWAHLRQGRLRLGPELRTLEDVDLELRVAGNLVKLEASGRAGAGRLAARAEGQLVGWSVPILAGEVTADAVAVAAGARVVTVDLKARLSGGIKGQGAWLEARVDRGTIRLPRETTAELHPIGELDDVTFVDGPSGRAPKPATRGARAPLVTLHLVTPRGVGVKSDVVDGEIGADLNVAYGRGPTSISGEAWVIRGEVKYAGQRYEVTRGRATFDGRSPPDPRVDLRLTREESTAALFIDLDGRLSEFDVRLSADPPVYDQQQLLGFLMGGSPDDLADPGAGAPVDQRAVAVGLLAGLVHSAIGDYFPIDVLRVEGGEAEGQTSVTAAKWLTRRLFVGIRYRSAAAADPSARELVVEYRLTRSFSVDVHAGDRENVGTDVLWVIRF